MSIFKDRDWGSQSINPEILGGVSAGQETVRAKGLKSLFSRSQPVVEPEPGSELQGTTQDFYTQRGGRVSIEQASYREQDLKDVLDGRQVSDNLGWDSEGTQGLKPCDLLEKQRGRRR